MALTTSLIISYLLLHGKSYVAEAVTEYVNLFSAASDIDSSSSGSVSYDCIFTNLWTKSRHPSDYPNDAHWSPPVVVSHNSEYTLFEEGEASTEGLESVAETGNTKTLLEEIAKAGDAVFDTKVGSGMKGKRFVSQKIMNVGLDSSRPYLSMVTMVAPSPDWFTGLNDFDMRDADSGNWLQEVILDLFPWDSGTDSGKSYNSANNDIDGNVQQLTINTIPTTKVFESPEGLTVLPVGRFQCQLNDMQATTCKREISESCNNKNKSCCPGLVCMKSNNPTGGKQKKKKKKVCLPLRYEGERCKKNSDCISGLDCVNKSCS